MTAETWRRLRWRSAVVVMLAAGGWLLARGLLDWERGLKDPGRATLPELLDERREFDRTVWAKELLAQEYEEYAIETWDRLRASEDKWAVIKDLEFATLTLARTGRSETVEWGIQRRRDEGPGERMTPESWRAWIDRLEGEGYRFVQGEVHHRRFRPAGRFWGSARSVFTFAAHVFKSSDSKGGGPGEKIQVKGAVEVTWARRREEGAPWRPERVEVTEARFTTWTGPEVMKRTSLLTPGPAGAPRNSVQPLIVYDLDGDGDSDLAFPRFNELYRNDGRGRFAGSRLVDAPDSTVLAGTAGAVAADFNGDGVVDLLLFRKLDSALLYRGRRGGAFVPVPDEIELPGVVWENPQAPTAGDVDGDGDLDVWVGQYRVPYRDGNFPTPYYDANDGFPSHLLINDGTGRFSDGTERAGLAGRRRRNYSASFVDLDRDGDLDLVTVNDFSGLDAFRNDGTGRFEDATRSMFDRREGYGMAHAFGDFNRDGRVDLYLIGMSSTTAKRLSDLGLGRRGFARHEEMRLPMGYGNRMLLAQGDGTFRQAPYNDQVAPTGWSWGVSGFDVDTDGDLDLYVANGHISGSTAKDYCTTFWRHDIYSQPGSVNQSKVFRLALGRDRPRGTVVSWNPFEHNVLWLNRTAQGREEFINVGFLFGAAFEFDSRGVVTDDLNLDGRPDLIVAELGSRFYETGEARPARVHVLENRWPTPGHWIGVRLREAAGRSPQGARITVTTAAWTQEAVIVSGDSFECQHPASKLFGLGEDAAVGSIEVRWTDGTVRTLSRPSPDRYHDL